MKQSSRDSLGNTLTPEQQEYFKESKVRDKKGNLMVLYHGTTANFNTFKKGDIGFHFGTKGAARGRVGYGKNVTLKEIYLDIHNPIVFDEDLGSWDADFRLTRELYERGILTWEEAETVLLTDNKQYRRTTEAANKKLSEVLQSKGYDGIEYSNTFESKNTTTSYIVFNSNQAKEITNEAPTKSADIRHSSRKSVDTNGKKRYNKNRIPYNSFATEAMKWAYSDKTEVGEQKFFSRNDRWVLLEKSEDGFVEMGGYTNAERIIISKEIEERNVRIRNGLSSYIALYEGRGESDLWIDGNVEKQQASDGQGRSIYQSKSGSDRITDNQGSESGSRSEIKRSSRDTTYLSAVKRGDMETAQRMVDEVAKANGYNCKRLKIYLDLESFLMSYSADNFHSS